jgi:hypothetical protein
MVIEALKAARDFIESDRQDLAESLTVNGEIVFEDDIDRNAMAEYVKVLGVIDGALEQALAAQPVPAQPVAHIVGEIDHTGKVWKPVQPAPVQEPTAGRVKELADRYGLDASMIGALHKDMLREIDRLEYANAELLQAISKTVQENLHLADGDNCTLVHLVRAVPESINSPKDTNV